MGMIYEGDNNCRWNGRVWRWGFLFVLLPQLALWWISDRFVVFWRISLDRYIAIPQPKGKGVDLNMVSSFLTDNHKPVIKVLVFPTISDFYPYSVGYFVALYLTDYLCP